MSNLVGGGYSILDRSFKPIIKSIEESVDSAFKASAHVRSEMTDIISNIIPAATKVAEKDIASAVIIGQEATTEASKNIAATSSRLSKKTSALLQDSISAGLRVSNDIRAEMADIVGNIVPVATKTAKTNSTSALIIGREAASESSKQFSLTSRLVSGQSANLLEASLHNLDRLASSINSRTNNTLLRTIPQQFSLARVTTFSRSSKQQETGIVRSDSMSIGVVLNQTFRKLRSRGHALIYPSPFKLSWDLTNEPLYVGKIIDENHLNAKCIRENESHPSFREALHFLSDGMRIIAGTAARIDPSRSYGDGDIQIEIIYLWRPSKSNALTSFQNLEIGTFLKSAGNFEFKAVGKLLDPSDIACNGSDEVERVLTIQIDKHRPDIQWTDPDDIVYGTELDHDNQLNAICLPISLPPHFDLEGSQSLAIDGSWDYQPAAGTRLPAGCHDLRVAFFPTDRGNCISPIEKKVQLKVHKFTPRIQWDFPKTMMYGGKLNYGSRYAVCLDSGICDGIFEYDPPEERILYPARTTHELRVVFKPTDILNFNIAQASCLVYVEPCQLEICWEAPAPIEFGTSLCHEQLNAKCNINVSGFFEYNPPSGTVLPVREDNRLSVLFQPFDKESYLPASKTVFINVLKKKPSLQWIDPPPIVYGTPIDVDILNAVCSNEMEGTFDYSITAGTQLSTGIHIIRAKFTPENELNFDTAQIIVPVTVLQFVPTLTWPEPNSIVFGTKLSSTQLCATCVEDIAGLFDYFPTADSILSCGQHTLNVTFTPIDQLNFSTVSASVTVKVEGVMVTLQSTPVKHLSCGTELLAAHINAYCTEDIEGTFVYDPPLGSVLIQTGIQEVKIFFEPDDSLTYQKAFLTTTIEVTRILPTLTWQAPGTMYSGQPLSEKELNACCTEDLIGKFIYSPPLGYRLSAGLMQTLHVTFIPAVESKYSSSECTVFIDVLPLQPLINWNQPSAISYGTRLSDIQLNAFSVEGIVGTFEYDPPVGSVLPANDSYLLNCVFLPEDTCNYSSVRSCVSLTITKTVPTLSWTTPSAIEYGTPLSSLQLNATCNENIPGKFLYSPTMGDILQVNESHKLTVDFIPDDSINTLPVSHFVTLEVKMVYPTLIWGEPDSIPLFSALCEVQLNCYCNDNVDGDFEYNPPCGTVLPVGHHTLHVTFSPTDTKNFHVVYGAVNVRVVEALRPTIVWPEPSPIIYGTPLSSKQLCAYSVDNIDGDFEYIPHIGSILEAGSMQQLSVIFRPKDTFSYTTVQTNVTLSVEKLSSSLSWTAPADLKVGTPLDGLQLNAVCEEGFEGVFDYNPSYGTLLPPGSDQSLVVAFYPTDSINISSSTMRTTINVVEPKHLTIFWPQPAAIEYGTMLTAVHLNATCKEFDEGEIQGVTEYNVPHNAVLPVGDHELTVVFKPSDTICFSDTTTSILLTVKEHLSTNRTADISSDTATPVPETVSDLQMTNFPADHFSEVPSSTLVTTKDPLTTSILTDPSNATRNTAIVEYTSLVSESYSSMVTLKDDSVEKLTDDSESTNISISIENPTVRPSIHVLSPRSTVLPQEIAAINIPITATESSHSEIQVSNPQTVRLKWPPPSNIFFGSKLSEQELNAEVADDPVDGSFLYQPSHGEVLPAGVHVLLVVFKPFDQSYYSESSMQVEIEVEPFKPTILWNPPNSVAAGTQLTEQFVHATCKESVEGTFHYHPPIGTVIEDGPEFCLSVEFTPYDTLNFSKTTIFKDIAVESPVQPTIIWREPANIPFNTLLSSVQLCAVVNESIEGEFIYDPPCGFKLSAGLHILQTKFVPTDKYRYSIVEAKVEICVEAIKPTILWKEVQPIVFGTPLSKVQLSAICVEEIEGELEYNHIEGTLLPPGLDHQLSVTFRPLDNPNCYVAHKSVTLSVIEPTAVVIVWPVPPSIVYGTPLSDRELNAHCVENVEGRFEYSPAPGTKLNAGDLHPLSVSFFPEDTIRYKTTNFSNSIFVEQAIPNVIWENPSRIFYGTELNEEQLNASCDEVLGMFSYSPSIGTVLSLGIDQSLSVVFVPNDSKNYSSITKTVMISVLQRTDITLFWSAPEPISYGTPLSESILNAKVNEDIDGYFVYNPPIGTVLSAGYRQKLTVTFTSKENKYVELQEDVFIDVHKAPISIYWDTPSAIKLGTPLSSIQLSAICDEEVSGTYVYDPPSETVLPAGEDNCLSVSFLPMDNLNYCSATGSVKITVIEPKLLTLIWNTPTNITYGVHIDDKQLNAKCEEFEKGLTDGTIEYNVPLGSLLSAGCHELVATFKPSDELLYDNTAVTVILIVEKVLSSLSWLPPANIKWGSPLTSTELNAVCNEGIDGVLIYDPPLGTVLAVGVDHILSVRFVPVDEENFTEAKLSTVISVIEPRPITIIWCPPTDITYGTAVGEEFFSAVCDDQEKLSIKGHFTYSISYGAILNPGTHEIIVHFIPMDTISFSDASACASFVVHKIIPTLSWASPSDIKCGTTLSDVQLCASCNDNFEGIFEYDPPIGTALPLGTDQVLSVVFNPFNKETIASATAAVRISVVEPREVAIHWPTPADIQVGTPLSEVQLNAQVDEAVTGELTYNQPIGTLLGFGNQHELFAAFQPHDTLHYKFSYRSVYINVRKRAAKLFWELANNQTAMTITYGTPLSEELFCCEVVGDTDIEGALEYSHRSEMVLECGTHEITAIFTPADLVRFGDSKQSVIVTVIPLRCEIQWRDHLSDIFYGQLLNSDEFDAKQCGSCIVEGLFRYSPPAGSLLDAGENFIACQYIPKDTTRYASSEVLQAKKMVRKYPTSIGWLEPSTIVYGTELSELQLSAFVLDPLNLGGHFEYDPTFDVQLPAGDHSLHAVFIPNSTNYSHAEAKVTLNVKRAALLVKWESPQRVVAAPMLRFTTAQLNATVSVADPMLRHAFGSIDGNFEYSPCVGDVVDLTHDSLQLFVKFIPVDSNNFECCEKSINLVIERPPLRLRSTDQRICFGEALVEKICVSNDIFGGYFLPQDGRIVYPDYVLGAPLAVGNHEVVVNYISQELALLHCACELVLLITVVPAETSIEWEISHAIEYGEPLNSKMLNAFCSTCSGSFDYFPPLGTLLPVGSHELTASFSPDNETNFNKSTQSVVIEVKKPVCEIQWLRDPDLQAGDSAGDKIFNAVCWHKKCNTTVSGSFVYSVDSDYKFVPGSKTLSANFLPEDIHNYSALSITREVFIEKIIPLIQWNSPAEVALLTTITPDEHLAAVAVDHDGQELSGAFVFDPPAGTILDRAGKIHLRVEFTPADEHNYKSVSHTVYITVLKGRPTLQWAPSQITSVDLVDPNIFFKSTFRYNSITVEGTTVTDIRNNGVKIVHKARIRFMAGNIEFFADLEPEDRENYESVSEKVLIPVERGRIRLAWPVPVPITYGTPLGPNILSAHCVDIIEPGIFVYEPRADSLLSAGQHKISVRFNPNDSDNYEISEAAVNLMVNKAVPKVEWLKEAASTPFNSIVDEDTLRCFWQSPVPGHIQVAQPSNWKELDCGQHDLALTFLPDDTQNYDVAHLVAVLTVCPVNVKINSSVDKCEMEYQLDLTVDVLRDLLGVFVTPTVSGTFHWASQTHPSLNLDIGEHQVEIVFDPADSANYNLSKATFTILVLPMKVEVRLVDLPRTLVYENPLTEDLLCAKAVISMSGEDVLSGDYEYLPALGTILIVGEHHLKVTFTPSDIVHICSAVGNAVVTVLPKEIKILCSPVTLTYGRALLESDLIVMQDRPDPVPGILTYFPENIFDTVLEAGEHVLTVQFNPVAHRNYFSPAVKVTVLVKPRQPELIWEQPKIPIEFGQPLSTSVLNAVCMETSGTLTYSARIGDVLEVGQHVVSVAFTPFDMKNFVAAEKRITVTVIITPKLSAMIQPLQFGDELSSAQTHFDARFGGDIVPGSWRLSPELNGILEVGEYRLTVEFTPQDLKTFSPATTMVTLTVLRCTPPLRWSLLDHPPTLTYGTPLTRSHHLNAVCEAVNIPGCFEYNFSDGQVLQPGSYELSAHFIPADEVHYTPVQYTVALSVLKIVPTMVWATKPPQSIDYGVSLTPSHLQAASKSVRGIITYSPPLGSVLSGGRHTLTATLTPEDSEHYSNAIISASIIVNRLTPTLIWPAPSSLPFGRPLTELQLCAQLEGPHKHVKGRFIYSPGLGRHLSVLRVGPQILCCEFIPDEPDNFNPAYSEVSIEITKTKPELIWDKRVRVLRYGTPLNRESHLNARYADPFVTADFSYDKSPGQILDVGHWRISLIARPHDKSSYYPDHKVIDVLVEKAIPQIEWSPQGNLAAGDLLTSAQLCATLTEKFYEEVHGLGHVHCKFVYDPPIGFRLGAGQHELTVTAHCGNNFDVVEKKVIIDVEKAVPILFWNTVQAMSFGQPIESDAHLNAVAVSHDEKVSGTYFYEPPVGTLLSPGQHTLTVRFEPTDADNFSPIEQTQTFIVNRVAPVILWDNPSSIDFGVVLTDDHLNARLEDSTLESFFICSYTPPLGHTLSPGNNQLTVTYHPNPTLSPEVTACYSSASRSVSITVNKIQPRLIWSGLPDQLGWDTVLQENKHLNASVEHSKGDVLGAFRYYCGDEPLVAGNPLSPGTHELKCEFIPEDNALYSGAVFTRQITVDKKDPVLAWNPPESARIYMGVPLTPLKQPEVCNAECISDCFGRFSYQIRETLADKSVVVLAKFTPIDSNARIYSEATITRVIPVGGSYAEWAALPKLEDRVVDPLLLYGDNRVFTMFPYKDKHYADQGYSRSPLRSTARAKSAGASSGERSRSSPARSGPLTARKS